ncbi:hypothetical protein DFH27DRAFT_579004 [Peziza echinospora]|nr:hypothetical protein DFH27DRAFT_579004 [Peziza echinospora]
MPTTPRPPAPAVLASLSFNLVFASPSIISPPHTKAWPRPSLLFAICTATSNLQLQLQHHLPPPPQKGTKGTKGDKRKKLTSNFPGKKETQPMVLYILPTASHQQKSIIQVLFTVIIVAARCPPPSSAGGGGGVSLPTTESRKPKAKSQKPKAESRKVTGNNFIVGQVM